MPITVSIFDLEITFEGFMNFFISVSGMGLCLARKVVDNAVLDLSPISYESAGTSSSANSKPYTESLPQSSRRKRKHGSTTGSIEDGHDGSLEVGSQKNHPTTLISLRIAALEALEALLTVVCASLISVKCRVNIHWCLRVKVTLILECAF